MNFARKILLSFGFSGFIYVMLYQTLLFNRGFDPAHMGYIITVVTLLDLILSVPTGFLADTYGVKKISIAGVAVLLIANIIGFIVEGWIGILAGFLVFKMAESTLNGVLNVWAKDSVQGSQTTGTIFTRHDQMMRIGMILCALCSGVTLTLTGYESNLIFIFPLIISGFLAYFVLKGECSSKSGSKRTYSDMMNSLKGILNTEGAIKTAMTALFVLGIAEGMMSATFWPRIKEIGINTPMAIASIGIFSSVSRVAGQEFFLRIIKKEETRFLSSLFLISFFSFVFASNLPPIVLAVSWLFRIFCYASYFPLLNSEIIKISGKELQSTALSAAPTITALGMILGSLVTASLKINGPIAYSVIGVLCACTALLWQKILFPRSRTATSM